MARRFLAGDVVEVAGMDWPNRAKVIDPEPNAEGQFLVKHLTPSFGGVVHAWMFADRLTLVTKVKV